MSEDSGTQTGVTDRTGTEVPAELDGVDLTSGDCPNCDGSTPYIQNPAGYYTCPDCWSTWAGDPEEASIVDYCKADTEGTDTDRNGGGRA